MTAPSNQSPAVLRAMLEYIVEQCAAGRNVYAFSLTRRTFDGRTLPLASVKRHIARLIADGAISVRRGKVTVLDPSRYAKVEQKVEHQINIL